MARPNRLLAEYLPAMRAMPFAKAEELAGMGIPWTAIAAVCPAPMRIVIDRAGDRFWPDDAGELGWVFPVAAVDPCCPELIESDDPLATVSTGAIIDLAASFSPGAPGLWALRLGHATVLGAIPPQYMAPPPVRVHRDIAAWLRAGCNDIVLLTRDQDEAQRILRQIHRIDYEDDAEQDSSPAPFQSGPALNRRRLEGVVRKIITAAQVEREGALGWACQVLGAAAAKGEIRADVARAMLVRAGIRAGLAETASKRLVAAKFRTTGGLNEGERRRPRSHA
jgi:hypothetical protein